MKVFLTCITSMLLPTVLWGAQINSDVERTIQQNGATRVAFSIVDPRNGDAFYSRTYFDATEQIAELRKYLEEPKTKSAAESKSVADLSLYERGGYGYVTVDATGLARLSSSALVDTVSLVPELKFATSEAYTLTQGAALGTAGLSGLNVQVAILDGNFQRNHPALSGKLFEEVCFSLTKTGCAGANTAIGPGVAAGPASANWSHGTGTAGIVVSTGAASTPPALTPPASPTQGVKLTAIRVADSLAPDIQLIADALNWIEIQMNEPLSTRRYKIISMSFEAPLEENPGNNFHYHTCDNYIGPAGPVVSFVQIRNSIARLRDRGVIIVAASGNNFIRKPGMAFPACLSGVISASATWDSPTGTYYNDQTPVILSCSASTNKNACYANRNWMTRIAAPGSTITSPWVRFSASAPYTVVAYTTSGDVTATATHGTSFSAPIVASCLAQIYQQLPSLDPKRLFASLSQETLRSTPESTQSQDNYEIPLLKCSNLLSRMQSLTHGLTLSRPGLSGTWYQPVLDGQGFVFEVNTVDPSNRYIFGGWYTYRDPSTTAVGGMADNRWLVLQNNGTVSPTSTLANLRIYQTKGGVFNTPNPPSNPLEYGESTYIGDATLRFHNCTQATLHYDIFSGSSIVGTHVGDIELVRLLPAGNVRCTENDYSQAKLDLLPEEDLVAERFWWSGSWFNPASAGQGLVIEVNPSANFPFLSWYTTKPGTPADGENLFLRGRWFTMQPPVGATESSIFKSNCNRIENLIINRTTDGQFGVAAAIAPADTKRVGTARIQFNSCRTATLKYTFDTSVLAEGFSGLTGSIELERPGNAAPGNCVFEPSQTTCAPF